MTKDEIKTRLYELNGQMRTLNDEHARLAQQLAEMSTPFKVGDRVRQKGVLYEVSRISPGYRMDARLFGKQIKKGGAAGVRQKELHEWDGPVTPAPPAS